jgi:ABC-type multidrug transport system permease subunit
MTTLQKILLFVVLPVLAPFLLPPRLLGAGGGPILFLGALIGISALLLSPFLWRGWSKALTLAIFLQGLNVIMRLMMFFPNLSKQGIYDIPWLITSLLSMSLCLYLVLRLDRTDVRVTMVR